MHMGPGSLGPTSKAIGSIRFIACTTQSRIFLAYSSFVNLIMSLLF